MKVLFQQYCLPIGDKAKFLNARQKLVNIFGEAISADISMKMAVNQKKQCIHKWQIFNK